MRKTGGHWVGGTLHKLTTQPHPAKPPSLELWQRCRSSAARRLGARPEPAEPTARVGAAVAGRPPVRPESVSRPVRRRDACSRVSERLLRPRDVDQSLLLDLGGREHRHPPPAPGHPPRYDTLRLLDGEAVEVLATLAAGGALKRERLDQPPDAAAALAVAAERERPHLGKAIERAAQRTSVAAQGAAELPVEVFKKLRRRFWARPFL